MATDQMALSHAEDAVVVANGNGGVLGLFEKAIDKLSGDGAESAVAALEKLMDLHERIQDRESVRAFNAGMVKFQGECPDIPKNRTSNIATRRGGSFSYKYADTDSIRKTVKPILNKLGFAYSFDQERVDGEMFVCFILSHQDGETRKYRFQFVGESDSAASPQQRAGIGDTYAGRRAMQSGLGITLTDERDTDGAASGNGNAITHEQATNLQALIEETGTNHADFLKYFGVAEIESLTVAQFKKAVNMLERKRSKR